jgi:hypothetical protein
VSRSILSEAKEETCKTGKNTDQIQTTDPETSPRFAFGIGMANRRYLVTVAGVMRGDDRGEKFDLRNGVGPFRRDNA